MITKEVQQTMKKRWIALALAAVMAISLLPVTALGEETDPASGAETIEEAEDEAAAAEAPASDSVAAADESEAATDTADFFDWSPDSFEPYEGWGLAPAPEEEGLLEEEDAEAPANGAMDISKATVSGLKNVYRVEMVNPSAEGEAYPTIDGTTLDKFHPSYTLKMGSKTLKEGTDYVVAYETYDEPIGLEIEIRGKGDYSGTVYIARPYALAYTFAGKNRFATNAKILNIAAGSKDFSRIVVVWGRDYPDALAANAYAGIKNSPLLLTERESVPAAIKSIITAKRDQIKEVVVIGGKMDGAIKALKGLLLPSVQIRTIAGSNRYQTADAVTKQFLLEKYGVALNDKTTQIDASVFVTTGETPADALSASSWSYILGIPVLLVKGGTFNKKSDTANVIKHFKTVYLLGDSKVVKDSVVPKGAAKVRLGGKNRWATSRKIANYFITWIADHYSPGGYPPPCVTVYVPGANDLFPDALAAGQMNLSGLPTAVVLIDKNHASTFAWEGLSSLPSSTSGPPLIYYYMYNFCVGSAGKDAGSGSEKGKIYNAFMPNLEKTMIKVFDELKKTSSVPVI